MSEVKQSDRSVIFNFVRSELEALPYLSDNRSNQEVSITGVLKPVAYMILAKLALSATEVYAGQLDGR